MRAILLNPGPVSLSEAVRFRTVSHQDAAQNDVSEWDRFHAWLQETYPAAHAAMTREVSRLGIGLAHKGSLNPGEVTVKLASDTRQFEYRVRIEWCYPVETGMFISGGRFVGKPVAKN